MFSVCLTVFQLGHLSSLAFGLRSVLEIILQALLDLSLWTLSRSILSGLLGLQLADERSQDFSASQSQESVPYS